MTIKIVTDPSTTANLVLTGGVNAAAVTGSDEERVLAAGLDSKTYTTLSGEFIFNHFRGPTHGRPCCTAGPRAGSRPGRLHRDHHRR